GTLGNLVAGAFLCRTSHTPAPAVHPPDRATLPQLLRALPRINYHLLTIGERPMKRLTATSFLMFLTAAGLPAAPPTFNKEVVRIFQQRCQGCHHPGAIGPFSLMDYATLRPYGRSIRERVVERTMPVWKPIAGIGDFLDPQVLTQERSEEH